MQTRAVLEVGGADGDGEREGRGLKRGAMQCEEGGSSKAGDVCRSAPAFVPSIDAWLDKCSHPLGSQTPWRETRCILRLTTPGDCTAGLLGGVAYAA